MTSPARLATAPIRILITLPIRSDIIPVGISSTAWVICTVAHTVAPSVKECKIWAKYSTNTT